jgi:transcription-repair coupling factor (superfamily II helicase)
MLPAEAAAQLYVGVCAQARAFALHQHWLRQPLGAVVLCDSAKAADTLCAELQFWNVDTGMAGLPEPVLYPEVGDYEAEDPRSFEAQAQRVQVLAQLAKGSPVAVITTLRAVLQPAPSTAALSQSQLILRRGQRALLSELVRKLTEDLHYSNEAMCELPGQFAVRGGLVDIYPVQATEPVRLDFFGDELESLRTFDPTSQRTESPLEQVTLLPAQLGAPAGPANKPSPWGGQQPQTLLNHLPEAVNWVIIEPDRLVTEQAEAYQVPEAIAPPAINIAHVMEARGGAADTWLGLSELDVARGLFADVSDRPRLDTEGLHDYRPFADSDSLGLARVQSEAQARKQFFSVVEHWLQQGYQLHLCAPTQAGVDKILTAATEAGAINEASLRQAIQHIGPLSVGFRYRQPGAAGVLLLSENEVFGLRKLRLATRRRRRPGRKAVDQALDFAELADGDPLVHENHGVCLFRGLQTLEIGNTKEEVISLEFADALTLHVKLHDSHLLSRYVGLSKRPAKLGKLGGGGWTKARAAAERATLKFAAELLRLQAQRDATPGHAYGEDAPELVAFERAFAHAETPDQLRAIAECKADMQRTRPMDRLLCGDVGFGKTEVALRACLKAALEGKQAALLVPTTVLCQQHYMTFQERMADLPIVVEMLSRFRSPRQAKEIKQQLKAGTIDIIVGTHSLLSKQVSFKDLGLLVIDEEHRFGVRQKEKIKAMKAHVDVLAMSATPIPRTLYGALVGARDLSVIETPPQDRLPIETFVKTYDEQLIGRAIRAELERGGQVFYLHNRVTTIEATAAKIQALVPEASVGLGHGQMGEQQLERVMVDFVSGGYDVLVCTTIIETGLDIPNCNTLIIEGADRFGLGQLYQLRGRVGRFNRQAFAYLLLHRHAGVLDTARKRLGAIRQHNQLGAGLRVAMRDLELRGAGNLLGPEQSGHIAGVGFELYCQLLRQSVARLQGNQSAELVRATLRLDFVVMGEAADLSRVAARKGSISEAFSALQEDEAPVQLVEASLPPEYLKEPQLRIGFYRKLASCAAATEVAEVAEELKDRFGRPPEPVKALLLTTEIRIAAEHAGIAHVQTRGAQLRLQRAGTGPASFVQVGKRFPRLTRRKPLKKLEEIRAVLLRHSTLQP